MAEKTKAKAKPAPAPAPAPARRKRRATPAVAKAPAAQPLRGRIPALAPAHAQALRGFFSAPHTWLLADHGLMHFSPGRATAPAETFELDAEGTRVGLRLQATAVAIGDGLHWSDFDGPSRILAWSLAHEPQLMRLSEALGVALAPLLEPGDGQAQAEATAWLDFLVEDDSSADDPDAARRAPSLQGTLRLPVAWFERLLARAEPPFADDPPPPLGRWRGLPAGVSIGFEVPPLSAADWGALAPGSVFVAGHGGRRPAFYARACGRTWPLAPVAGGWRIDGPAQHLPRTQETAAMSENQSSPGDAGRDGDAPAPADPDAATRALPVQVAFEIGRQEMPIGRLAELQPGYVFPVPSQLEGANVTIRANGEAVGQGELVSVGDTLGVRLLSWK